jgi:hypothetical protein
VLESLGSVEIVAASPGVSPGRIVVDSDGSACATGEYVIQTQGAASITAENATGVDGVISSWALANGSTNAYESGDHISPAPSPSSGPVGRNPVDWRYNCKAANGCPYTSTNGPYIDNLVAAYGGTGQPTGFSRYSTSYPCLVQNNVTVTVPTGNWWIDCTSGLDIKGTVMFGGGSNIVLDTAVDAAIDVGAQGVWTIGCTALACTNDPAPSILYLRTGNLDLNGGSAIKFKEVFTYVTAPGVVDMGGNTSIQWTAPVGGNFDDLLVWSEASGTINLQGTADMVLEGTFFAPNSLLELQGTPGTSGIATQMFVDRVHAQGNAELRLAARDDRSTLIAANQPFLIR